jgi:hypothetical protein
MHRTGLIKTILRFVELGIRSFNPYRLYSLKRSSARFVGRSDARQNILPQVAAQSH